MSKDGGGREGCNPYAPSNRSEETLPRALRIYVWLNASLILLLILVPIVLHFVGTMHARDAVAKNGDPITYQHYYYIKPDLAALVLYFGLPNGVCAWLRRKYKGQASSVGQ